MRPCAVLAAVSPVLPCDWQAEMHALELRDDSLRWETERQNRILQDAAEQKKKLARIEDGRREQAGTATQTMTVPPELWIDRIQRIPAVRSALIPLDEEKEPWSKPFSLAKADLEPWLSLYRGYRQSRLFLHSPAVATPEGGSHVSSLDYPVRALLELKRVDAKLIIEPPVQINGQVEYLDLEGELENGADPALLRQLLRSAEHTHERQIALAVGKGREMGDALHEALMGEGHVNLIAAWEKVFKRKPNVEELHLMLTSGRVKVSAEKKPIPSEVKPAQAEVRPSARTHAPPAQEIESPRAALPKQMPPQPASMPLPEDDDEAIVTLSSKSPVPAKKGGEHRRMVIHFLNAAVCGAAIAAFIYLL